MHMRLKKWAKPELAKCPYYTEEAYLFKGKWAEQFPLKQPFHIELGCGKGVASVQMVYHNRNINYLLIDISSNVLGATRRNIAEIFKNEPINNVMIARWDISRIFEILSDRDEVERIYISFCNPWTKRKKYEKRRLTHPRQLFQYREFLKKHGEIWFKTDDNQLFDDSMNYFKEAGFSIAFQTSDLHCSGFKSNYISEHEKKYMTYGIPIKFAIGSMNPNDYQTEKMQESVLSFIQHGGTEKDRIIKKSILPSD